MENNQELEKELEGTDVTEETVEEIKDTEASVEDTEIPEEEAVAEEIPEAGKEPETVEKKGFFGKKKDKKDKKDQQIEELTDKVKRQLAEFENFRNRTEKEKSRMYEFGARDVVEKILPVIDNFERGIASVPEADRESPVASGMELIYKQLMTAMDEIGVKVIEAVGNEFDPNYHNAVMHVEDEDAGENTVVEEFQKGYIYKETVIRHSMVKVAN